MQKSLGIIIPVYNEAEVLPQTFERILNLLSQIKETDIHLIFVNDGSLDASGACLEGFLSQSVQRLSIQVIEFSRNFGHSAAIFAGLRACQTQYVAIIDADLQDPPELIPEMLELLIFENWDVVYGQRVTRLSESVFKRLSAWFFYRMLNLFTGIEIPKDTGDFRVMTAQVKDALLQFREQDPFLRGLVAWLGFKQRAFHYTRQARQKGVTKYSFKKMARFASLAFMSFSSKPLRFSFYLGLLGFFLSLVLIAYALHGWSVGTTVPGWVSTLLAFSLMQSLALIVQGLQGIYMGRIYEEVMNRPRYLVKKNSQSEVF